MAPWLAAEPPVFNPKKTVCTIRLRPALWSDGTPFTAHDVVFTGELINKLKIPRYNTRWNFIEKIEALDDHTVRFTLKKPKAVFLTRTLTTPMVQKKQWAPVLARALKADKPLISLLHARIDVPVGAGPFSLAAWRRGVFMYLKRNPHFFGRGLTIHGWKLGPNVAGIIYKVYGTSDAAILDLRKGDIDMYWASIQPGYLRELSTEPEIGIYPSQQSAIYYLGFNLRRPPFQDAALREATAYLVGKEFIIKRILQGAAEPMHSMVPTGNRVFHNPEVPPYGAPLDRAQRLREASRVLKQAGYSWKIPPVGDDGRPQTPSALLKPDGKPLPQFTILTPPADYDPNRAMSGMMIQEWLRQAGMKATVRPMAFGALLDKVKGQHDFDCFVLGYGHMSLDPGYLGQFFGSKSDKKRGWNMSGYHNPEFDKLALASSNAMNPEKRREIVFKMQHILMRDLPYLPLYNPLMVLGVRKDRFRGWVEMTGGIGNLWSLCHIKPITSSPERSAKP
jgi:ABC-type transport system substrate-binding protein